MRVRLWRRRATTDGGRLFEVAMVALVVVCTIVLVLVAAGVIFP